MLFNQLPINIFPYPTSDEVAEQGNIAVRNMMVSDTAIATVANMSFAQSVIGTGFCSFHIQVAVAKAVSNMAEDAHLQ
jgi:hypothetical protein